MVEQDAMNYRRGESVWRVSFLNNYAITINYFKFLTLFIKWWFVDKIKSVRIIIKLLLRFFEAEEIKSTYRYIMIEWTM